MYRRMCALTAAACGALALALSLAPGASAQSGPRYYLALGDSLSQGVQPNAAGKSLETNQGYVDQLAAFERHRVPSLRVVKLGCPGDTTGSMLTGHGNGANARLFRCDRAGGSQLTAAERFLRAHHHPGEVALVTVDIGANDVDGCANVPALQIGSCVSAGEASIKHDLPLILKRLRKAAPAGTVLADMTLYDPALSGYFSADSSARGLATASVSFLKQINAEVTSADSHAGFRTADVAGAFASYDSADHVQYAGQSVPVNVADVSSWTWACTPPPRGPNIHANKTGYAVIAAAFRKVIGRL